VKWRLFGTEQEKEKERAAQRLLTQASKPASLQIKSRPALKFDNKLKLAKRKQETADTKKSAKKQEVFC
jgi:hypothetical protein